MWSWEGDSRPVRVCVCVETSEQLLCGRWNTSEAEPQLFFFPPQLKVSFHTAEAFCCGILQVTASGLICLSMKEMDTQRAPGERGVEERGTLHVERLGTTCVAFRPLYLIYRLSQDGFTAFRPLYSVILSHLTLNSFIKFTYFHLWTILNFHSTSSVFF